MLVIRMQRTGRSGHAQFRVVAQDSRFHPSSGRVVEYLGSYNPHSKVATLESDKITDYINKGAQPSDRVIKLLKQEGVKLPKRVVLPAKKSKKIKNLEKLRKNRPPQEQALEGSAGQAAEAKEPTPKPELDTSEPVAEEAPNTEENTSETSAAKANTVTEESKESAEAPAETETKAQDSSDEEPAEAAKTEE